MSLGLPISIPDLLHGRAVESERLELKAGWNPESILHTICAFANDFHNLGGGYVVIGVEEREGQPVFPPTGLDPTTLDRIQKELLNLSSTAIQPTYHPVVVPAVYEGRTLLVLWAPGGQTRPYRAKTSLAAGNREYAWYIRKGSSTVKARGAEEQELLSLAATVPFDDRVNQTARVEDLHLDLMRAFLDEVGSDLAGQADALDVEALGRQMQVVRGPREAALPVNVGLMFFHPEPHRFFPATWIDVVWFPDGPGGDTFVEKSFRGPLSRMLREALGYIRRNYIQEIVTKHPDRAEATRVESFPYAAIEEAVVNAVYHRGYDVREPVEVRITPEELVVLSYPGPDRSVRLEQLRQGRAAPRRYRNRRIGEFLKELDLTEGRATGIPKMLRVMRNNGSPPPEFEFDEDHSYFQVRLLAHSAVMQNSARGAESGAESGEGTDHVTGQVTGQVAGQVAGQVERLLRVLRGEMTRKDLQTAVGLSHRDHFMDSYLKPALADGLVERTIPDKPHSRLQKYRLTERGRAWLRGHEHTEDR
jgi:ATP-dependent DNA helicase RecG